MENDLQYATHLPLLTEFVLRAPRGPVLELGAGKFSTPILHVLCGGHRKLITVEPPGEWRDEFIHLEREWHTFPEEINIVNCTIALIDCSPAMARRDMVELLKDRARFLIIHDTQEPGYKIPFHLFKYRKDYTNLNPYTTVVSNQVDVNNLTTNGW